MPQTNLRILRYPGGKQRMVNYLLTKLPASRTIGGRFVEPFVGGAAVFFAINPKKSLLADVNTELIELYRGLRRYPGDVWTTFSEFPSNKKGYYRTRAVDTESLDLATKAARLLYLNRTCFKGMWRQNASGKFNVGYGGQDRRWAVTEQNILTVSRRLKNASLRVADFEPVIAECTSDDFIFLDPPYRPGASEVTNDHYVSFRFTYSDHERLASVLRLA
ncbi:MAG TPA: Dam family site-specific DNA-(adenine-N6)-methyltransferase, partial [Pyrinomonadaceae bacterium]|nr:Dam family site-specific DNA-(adenine-N6)-methyltransferase [Pyrinomonadaceae bacterium]